MASSVRVLNHPVMPVLQQFESLLSAVGSEYDNQVPDLMLRGRATVRVLRERFEDPAIDLISDSALSNAHAWLQQALTELQQAQATNNPQYLMQTGQFLAALDAFSQNLGQFPISSSSDALAGQLDEAQRRVSTIQELQLKVAADARASQDQQANEVHQFKSRVEAELQSIADQRKASENLLAALGGDGTSRGYSETANDEQASANTWRKTTIVLGILTAALALVLFAVVPDSGWESLVRRAGVTIPFALLTLYAGRQAAEHRREEREARRLQLAFGSVNAYLADLESIKRAELKSQLSAQLFGAAPGTGIELPSAGFPSSVELAQLLVELAARARAGQVPPQG